MKNQDLEMVRKLSEQLGYPVSSEVFRSRFEELSALPNHALFVVEDNKIRGWIHLETVFDLIEEKKVEIKAIVVDVEQRGQGYGKLLIQEALLWTQKRGMKLIYLNCNIDRHKAHEFYSHQGFALVKTSHFFEKSV